MRGSPQGTGSQKDHRKEKRFLYQLERFWHGSIHFCVLQNLYLHNHDQVFDRNTQPTYLRQRHILTSLARRSSTILERKPYTDICLIFLIDFLESFCLYFVLMQWIVHAFCWNIFHGQRSRRVSQRKFVLDIRVLKTSETRLIFYRTLSPECQQAARNLFEESGCEPLRQFWVWDFPNVTHLGPTRAARKQTIKFPLQRLTYWFMWRH